MPHPQTRETDKQAQARKESKDEARKALQEQQKRNLPTGDWPGKGQA